MRAASGAALTLLAVASARATGGEDPGRELDFWTGNWKVEHPGMAGTGRSKVYVSPDKCILMESWDGGKGHRGENVFAYSTEEKAWHGLFTDNFGRVHPFTGTVSPGLGVFDGPSKGPDGESVLNRVRIIRVSQDHVEQVWEKSKDAGATWSVEFKGEYVRER